MPGDGIKIVTTNRKAYHDYHIGDTYEAGLVLMGSEIKSIRAGHINLRDAFVQARNGELWLHGTHINLYDQASFFGHSDPVRPRKLLLHKREIARIMDWIREQSLTAVPTKLYLKGGRAKVEIGLARGKQLHDKREASAQRDAAREIQRARKGQYES